MKNVRSADGPTKGQVARLILELGPSTAATLGSRLGLTPAAIRRHLDNLLAEGLIETRTARTYGNRGRGRPAKVFVITADGYAASAGPAPSIGTAAGEELCQHHCPVAHVAAEFPQLCEAETEAFGRLLGTPVQRLATIAHGDGICTTHVTDLGKAAQVGAVVPRVTTDNTTESGGLLT